MTAERAINPNIFDVYADSSIVLPIVLANLMSDLLWRLSAAITPDPDPSPGFPPFLRGAQHIIDRHFTHLSPGKVAEINGTLDLETERALHGDDVITRATEVIVRNVRWRIDQGLFSADDPLLDLIAGGRFPAYAYANIDVLHACRRLAGGSSRPEGITSCLDETALLAALLMTKPTEGIDGICILATPTHYSVLGWQGLDGWWFYGKHELLDQAAYRARVEERFGGDPDLGIHDRIDGLDRIISRRGTLDLAARRSSIPRDEIARVAEAVGRFMGAIPPALQQAIDDGIEVHEPSTFDSLFAHCLELDSAEEVRHHIRAVAQADGPASSAAQEVLACYRLLDIADPGAYVAAARRGTATAAARSEVRGVADALSIARGISLGPSVLGDRDRIAMPDETLHLRTGTDRDRALLIHVLLETPQSPIQTLMLEDDSIVMGDDWCISATTLEQVEAPPSHLVRVRLSRPMREPARHHPHPNSRQNSQTATAPEREWEPELGPAATGAQDQ
ncbi:MAG: hypothetical protein HQ453_04525 [Actinobacteria bacterium]|nr:hypothetical protein [Actinomycetota bacterium]